MTIPLSRKKITVLIPCYNEESGICNVIRSFPVEKIRKQGFDLDILVIDNNSTDRTAEVATSCGAHVIYEPKKGKGNAIRTGFWNISSDTDYVVMLDGDDTYRPQEILRLVEILDSGLGTAVIGSRLAGRITEHSMGTFNRIGNWTFSFLVRLFYRVNVTDVLTGYFAWTRETIEHLRPHLVSKGFAIEMEMITKMAHLGADIYCVPITYNPRLGESTLRPIYDGARILWMFAKNLFWKPTHGSGFSPQTIRSYKIRTPMNMKISVVIPALNEESGIRATIKQIPVQELTSKGYAVEIIVVDNGSTDKTAQISRRAGAIVVPQPLRGYGNAYKAGFAYATGDIIATGDADMTYPFDELPHIIDQMVRGGFDFMNTDRLSDLNTDAMTFSHFFGNWLLSFTTKILFGWPFNDSQSGMWIFRRSILKRLDVRSEGMPFSQELKIEAYMRGFKCAEVPIEYRARVGEVKLNTISDGIGNITQLLIKRLSYWKQTRESAPKQVA